MTTHLILTPHQLRKIVRLNEEEKKEKDKSQVQEVANENMKEEEKKEKEKSQIPDVVTENEEREKNRRKKKAHDCRRGKRKKEK